MAIIERITLPTNDFENETSGNYPGLRISVRTTTSSMSDYPEWRVEDLSKAKQENIVTDGSCS